MHPHLTPSPPTPRRASLRIPASGALCDPHHSPPLTERWIPARFPPSRGGRAAHCPGWAPPTPIRTYLAAPARLACAPPAQPTWGSGNLSLRNFRRLRANEPAGPGITRKEEEKPGRGRNPSPGRWQMAWLRNRLFQEPRPAYHTPGARTHPS
ncbi:hypothetical protein P7K49_009492 [Saguinus oedipus]|uniref:Uncharacterized protein n=1 Tax=Saguinus oedipus TaxID=9490 RepID=A0ABQ9VKR9_SAGOE|nr:hypothetical protein P7K49_009492 [Saguinus oedipus]